MKKMCFAMSVSVSLGGPHFGTCESLGSSPVTGIPWSFDLLQLFTLPPKGKTSENYLYLDSDVWARCFSIIFAGSFILLSRFLAGSCSLKMSQACIPQPFDQLSSRVGKVNSFKTPEMRLYFDSDVWGGCLSIIFVGSFPYFNFLTKIYRKVRWKQPAKDWPVASCNGWLPALIAMKHCLE